jgi:uncharacterized sulfatase
MHMAHHLRTPAHFGLRGDRYKLVFFYGADHADADGSRDTPAAWEFYDLAEDPRETVNAYGNPRYAEIIAEMKRQLKTEREALNETDARYPRLKAIIDRHWDD